MRIAVIGSGIAGLSASWLLGGDHEVVLYEAHERPGMSAHGVDVAGVHADVPLRVFYAGYYTELLALYREIGVEAIRSDYSTTFSYPDGETYYRYHNRRPGLSTLWAFLSPRALRRTSRVINRSLLRYYRDAPREFAAGAHRGETIADYLSRAGYPREFVELFLLPAYAGIGTCSYERVRTYPAEVLNEYMHNGFFFTGVLTAKHGTPDVVERLSARVSEARYKCPVAEVRRAGGEVSVHLASGAVDRFEHVVVATQANHAKRFLRESSPEEAAFLDAFRYEGSDIVMHTDPAVMPRRRSDWGPVNFVVSPDFPRPMATIWTNRVQPRLRDAPDLFQTWNPVVEPSPEAVIARTTVERPAVDDATLQALADLQRLHAQPDRRVWFCGSYAARGIPLLESGVRSAMAVARALKTEIPWQAESALAVAAASAT